MQKHGGSVVPGVLEGQGPGLGRSEQGEGREVTGAGLLGRVGGGGDIDFDSE